MNTGISSNGDPPPPDEPGGGKPDCPHCGGLGFVVPDVGPEHPSFGRAVPCSCRAAELEARRHEQLMRFSQLGGLAESTFDNFIPEGHGLNEARRRNLRIAYETARAYAENPEGWLVLKGGYGCGKTHLAAAIANYRLEHGQPVLFVNTPDLLDHLRGAYNPNATTGYDQRFEQVRNAALLVLDDLGTQSNTEWAQEKLYQIFNYRYNARLPTVITTNVELESLEPRIRSRVVDPGLVQVVHILAHDFRGTGIGKDHSDLSTLNLLSDKTFENFDLREQELPRAEADNLRRALQTARDYAADPQGWLVFNSVAYGNGKTHLAAAIANTVINQGRPVLFIVVPDLLDHLRTTYNPAAGVRYDKRFEEVKTADLLVLDDLGTESATPWAREKLYQIFNYRYNARLATVITTALRVDDIDPKLRARMLDVTRCTFFTLEVPTYVGKRYRRRSR
ncbi:MAG: ATP-binding protein [Chloroflexi bacterium]|nr:ATP-binding protein [Chloroflexota bacterium]